MNADQYYLFESGQTEDSSLIEVSFPAKQWKTSTLKIVIFTNFLYDWTNFSQTSDTCFWLSLILLDSTHVEISFKDFV
jgi:hypothetical protein